MKIFKTLVAMMATALLFFGGAAQATLVNMNASNGQGDAVNVTFGVNDITQLINSISGSVTTATTSGPLAIDSLMPLSENGLLWIFDQKWLPGFNTNGLAFNFGSTFKANVYQWGSDLYFSIYPAGNPTYNPGHILTQTSFTNVPEPGALSLVALALAGVTIVTRRRSKDQTQ